MEPELERKRPKRRGALWFLGRIAIGLLAIVGGVFIAAVLGTVIPHGPARAVDETEELTRRILVISNTIHTDIAIPVEPSSLDAFADLEPTGLPIRHPEARWMLFGWGGRAFYIETPTLADIKPGPLFRALTVDSSVMHVDVFTALPETHPDILPLTVSDAEYAELLQAIADSFDRTGGQVHPIEGAAYGTADKFYVGIGAFNAILGCNAWTARMLREAGISTGLWNAIPPSLVASLRWFNGWRIAK